MKRLILLVAKTDLDEAFVVAAWEADILDTMGWEEVENEIKMMKEKWYPVDAEWREIKVDVDESELLKAFESPIVVATIVDQ